MKLLKKISSGQAYAGLALPFVLLAVGMLSGCQLDPAAIDFLAFPPRIGFPESTRALPQDTVSERQPDLAEITTRKFPISKKRNIVGGLAAITVQDGDTLPDMARHFGLGYNEITIANPAISPWTPKTGGTRATAVAVHPARCPAPWHHTQFGEHAAILLPSKTA